MEAGPLTWVGSPCGLHGPYKFYKAFRFHRGGLRRLLSVGDFFWVRCGPGEPLCVAELQLLWEERTRQQLLSSSKLYFLPEDTPQGRSARHGEDEVIAMSEKVIVRLKDLVRWTVWEPEAWSRGVKALPLELSTANADSLLRSHDSTLNCGLNFKDVLQEKVTLGEGPTQKQVLVLSYPRYCRYRSVVARLREEHRSLLTNQVVLALGGITVLSENTHILYCRDTFEHPTILSNKSVCDEFAPNLKGRPRKKKPSNCLSWESRSPGQGSEDKGHCQKSFSGTGDNKPDAKVPAEKLSGGGRVSTLTLSEERRGRGWEVEYRAEEQAFLMSLYKYMKERKTPIERIPYLGFKQINLWTMFQAAQSLGGYELITARRQWKNIYDELGGDPGSTSAATCTRRHYERLILPYERFMRGEEDKPLPQLKPRKQEAAGSSIESTNGICTTLKTKPSQAKDLDQSLPELIEHNAQLKLKPQICITRVDSPQPSPGTKKRPSPERDCQTATEIQLHQKEEVKWKRRCRASDPSHSPTSPMINHENSAFPLASPKDLNHAHSAVNLWQHQHVPLKDQCHAGDPGNLQSPTIPDPPCEQAELPRTEEVFFGFTTSLSSPGALPNNKPKVSSTGLPHQNLFSSNFGEAPPLITSSLTSRSIEEAAEWTGVAAQSSVVVLSRPSVIQHAQSFKALIEKEVKESSLSRSHPEDPRCSSTTVCIPRSSQTPQNSKEFIPKGAKPSQEQEATLSRVPNSLTRCLQSATPCNSNHSKSSNPKTAPPDDQPTDLSLPKSSANPLSGPHRCSTRHQENIPTPNRPPSVNIAQYFKACRVPLQTHSSRQDPAAVSSSGPTDVAAIGPTSNKLGSSISQRRMGAASRTPKSVLHHSSATREVKATKELDVGEGTEGTVLNSASPQIYPNTLYAARTFALSEVQGGDTFGIPLLDQAQSVKHHLQNPLQYLKTQPVDFFLPLVPPIAIQSAMIQRQHLAEAAAGPPQVYQQTYGDLIHHRQYSVSVNPGTNSDKLSPAAVCHDTTLHSAGF